MPDKYIIQRRTASGLETVAELPALENGKVDLSWLPVVGSMGSAIIERGSNANGEWVRWEDGTQVCYATLSNITPSWIGAPGWITQENVTFPAAFISVPKILGQTLDGLVSSRATFVGNITATATGAVISVRAISSDNQTGFSITYLAIGRWK